MFGTAFVREWIDSIQHNLPDGSMRPVDGTVTFPPINANRVLRPHEDALISTLGISGFDVKRVLIDLGSSADLLQMLAYRQMGLPSSTLENSRQILYGFNGATTTSLGDVVLPVQVGPVTSNMQFLVVKDLSYFNAIMGCVGFHSINSIPSTYHQMVSYLIEDGQINLLSNQLATCHCYQVVLESGHPINNEPCPEPSNVDEQ